MAEKKCCAAKKPAVKKAPAKKVAAKKPAVKKAVAKKPVAKKAVVKKPAAKKVAAKPAAKKVVAKKVVVAPVEHAPKIQENSFINLKIAKVKHEDPLTHISDHGQEHEEVEHPPLLPIVKEEPKVGRNEPCPCGSGRKYKKCCGSNKE